MCLPFPTTLGKGRRSQIPGCVAQQQTELASRPVSSISDPSARDDCCPQLQGAVPTLACPLSSHGHVSPSRGEPPSESDRACSQTAESEAGLSIYGLHGAIQGKLLTSVPRSPGLPSGGDTYSQRFGRTPLAYACRMLISTCLEHRGHWVCLSTTIISTSNPASPLKCWLNTVSINQRSPPSQ